MAILRVYNPLTENWDPIPYIKGDKGDRGYDVTTVEYEYYSSTSSSEPTGGEWSTIMPGYSEGRYIWVRTKTTNSHGEVYTGTPVLATLFNDVNSAELTRRTYETNRANAETARDTAEGLRDSAEIARASAELLRVSAETSRGNSEVSRANAEAQRVSAESSRVSVEAQRVANEEQRISNENARIAAQGRYPIVQNNTWWVWSKEDDDYVDTEVTAVGANGVGIASIELTSTVDLVDTYTITFDDGNTTSFDVTNGADGISPTITVTEITGGHEVAVTDAQGTQTFDVMDGEVTEAQLNEVKSEINDLTRDGSIMSLEKIVPYGFATNTGKDATTATSYWNTGLVYIGENRTTLSSNYEIYKVGFFGQFGDYLGGYNTTHYNIPIRENTFFVKVQFANSVVSFENSSNVKLYVSNETVVNPAQILPNGIKKENLSEELVTLVNKIDGIGELSYSGERIKLENKFTYGYLGNNSLTAVQSGAVYGDLLFSFNSQWGFNVYNLTNWTFVANGNYPTNLIPHANVAFFGNELYDINDNFPIVYINAYSNTGLPKGTLYVFRIANDYTMTLLQTITIGFTASSIWTDGSGDSRPYGNFAADFDDGYLYAYTLKDTSKVTRFFKFNLPTLSDGDVTFAESDILDYWDCDYFPFIQDNFCKNGKIYLLSGYGTVNNNGFLRVINTVSKKEISRMNLNKTLFTRISTSFEPEIITLYNDNILIGNKDVYKLIV